MCSVWLTQATSRVAVFPCRSPRSYGRDAPVVGESGLKGELAGTSVPALSPAHENILPGAAQACWTQGRHSLALVHCSSPVPTRVGCLPSPTNSSVPSLSSCFKSDPTIRVGVSISKLSNRGRRGFALFSQIFKGEEKRTLRALRPCWVNLIFRPHLLAGEPCLLGDVRGYGAAGAALPGVEAMVCGVWAARRGEGAPAGLDREPLTVECSCSWEEHGLVPPALLPCGSRLCPRFVPMEAWLRENGGWAWALMRPRQAVEK